MGDIRKLHDHFTKGDPPTIPFEELEHRAEEWECAMMYMDDLRVPRTDSDGHVYSIVGRIARLSARAPAPEVV